MEIAGTSHDVGLQKLDLSINLTVALNLEVLLRFVKFVKSQIVSKPKKLEGEQV